MDGHLAAKICKQLLRRGIISQEWEAVYVYGFELLISFLFNTVVILTIGILLHQVVNTLLFLGIFIFVRRYTGGYHASTYLGCKIATISTYLLVLGLSVHLNIHILAFLFLNAAGGFVILKWGPIENPNKPLTQTERRKYKIISIILFQLLLVLGCVLSFTHVTQCNMIFYTLLTIIALMLICTIERRTNHEENC